ncbi:site-specific integrase [Rhizobium sp. BK529]|uniref:tyrosine-type recombinase/integrase n=1 Tax=Rhizobium sp. BK529 TaxID=2586983 RepID=UPI002484978E|nr:site-specific integrase [Rhizobium sp. BK529]
MTAAFVKSVAAAGKYGDSNGLFLFVKESGAKSWVQRIVIRGKRRDIGLGSADLVTLAAARDAALDNRRAARAGLDPIADKKKVRSILTFEQAAIATHKELEPTWKNERDRKAFLATLTTYVFPRFGATSVADVSSADVRQAILAARQVAPEVARKLIFRISAVFKWAIAEGMRADNPARADALALPKVERTQEHRKALPYSEVAGCIDSVKQSNAWAITKLAFEFLVLTAVRSGEARGASPDEIDRQAKVWTIPAKRMKMKRVHRVPLCARALEILDEAAKINGGSDLIFSSIRGKALSDMTLSKLVKELGYDADIHGFRTSFRTWVQEKTDFPREVAETALAHGVGDAVERAYARSDLFERRREMMDEWAKFLSGKSDIKQQVA